MIKQPLRSKRRDNKQERYIASGLFSVSRIPDHWTRTHKPIYNPYDRVPFENTSNQTNQRHESSSDRQLPSVGADPSSGHHRVRRTGVHRRLRRLRSPDLPASQAGGNTGPYGPVGGQYGTEHTIPFQELLQRVIPAALLRLLEPDIRGDVQVQRPDRRQRHGHHPVRLHLRVPRSDAGVPEGGPPAAFEGRPVPGDGTAQARGGFHVTCRKWTTRLTGTLWHSSNDTPTRSR